MARRDARNDTLYRAAIQYELFNVNTNTVTPRMEYYGPYTAIGPAKTQVTRNIQRMEQSNGWAGRDNRPKAYHNIKGWVEETTPVWTKV